MSVQALLSELSFREKTAWAMAAILTAAGLLYADDVIRSSRALGATAPPDMHLIIGFVILVVVATVIASVILAMLSAREANTPADERERLIQHKAGNWAGYAMVVPVLVALWHYSVNGDGDLLFHLVFLSLLAAQVADYVLQIVLFRRGS